MKDSFVISSKNYLRKPPQEKPKKVIPIELNYLVPKVKSYAEKMKEEIEKDRKDKISRR